jgi:hypothetical protein
MSNITSPRWEETDRAFPDTGDLSVPAHYTPGEVRIALVGAGRTQGQA